MKKNTSTENEIPANEHWLHVPRAAAELQSALIWAVETQPSENLLSDIKDDNELVSFVARRAAASSQI